MPERSRVSGPFPVVGSNGIAGFHNEFTVKGPSIIVGRKGSAGEVTWIENDCTPIDTTYYVAIKQEGVLLRYLYYILQNLRLTELRGGAGVPGLNRNDAYDKEIPLPPLEEQEQIVAELDGYRKVIEGACQVLANYKPTIRIDPEWPRVKLGEVIRTITPPKKIQKAEFGKAGIYPIIDQSQDEISGWTDDSTATVNVSKPVVIFGDHTCSVKYTERPFVQGADGIKILETSDSLLPRFLFYWLKTFPIQSDGYKRHYSKLVETVIPLPPPEIQHRIVAELEAERALVEANRKLAEIFEKKIQAKLVEDQGEKNRRLIGRPFENGVGEG